MDVGSVDARRGTAAAGLALALALPGMLQGQQQEMREIDETRQVAGDVTVRVEALVRNVRVTGWDRDEVRVRTAVDPEGEAFFLEADRGTVHVEIDRRDDRRAWREGPRGDAGELVLSVPRGASLDVDVVNGSLVVDDVNGSVELESVNGDVRYAGDSERIGAETVNGRVELEAPLARRTRAGTVNGDLLLAVGGGFVEAEAVSGGVEIRAGDSVEAVTAETVAGSIDFRGRPVSGASLDFETHSGNVTVRVPREVQARLEATTFSGSIESALGGEARSASRWTSERSFRHTVGTGDVHVTVASFSGNVRFLEMGS